MGLWLVLLMGLVPISAQAVSATAAFEGESVKTPFGTYTSVPPERLRLALKSVDDITPINVHVPYEGKIAGTEAFAPFDQLERLTGSDQVVGLRGLGQRDPFAAAVFALSLLSLAGIPPLAGLAGKVLLL